MRTRVLALVAALAALGCGRKAAPPSSPTPPAASAARPIEVKTVDPLALRDLLAAQRGKVTVVNVWASWCLPCAAEFTALDRFAGDYAGRGVAVVGIGVDDPEVKGTAVQSFLAAHRPSFPVALKERGPLGPFRDLLDPAWDGSIPASFVLDREGRRVASLVGAQTYEGFARAVAPLAGGMPPPPSSSPPPPR